ncbi:MAG: alanyl-tRNA editing protein [Tissierellia bacterium]|nr:alanyl-tRNA editing protein [Tissierellia bacterium]
MTNKIYLKDPYLTEYKTDIIFSEYIDGSYQTLLRDTIFYPDKVGGQAGDVGFINDIKIDKSIQKGDLILHLSKEKVKGEFANIKIDYLKRLDSMQQHTGQHLLSAVFYKALGANTIGFHINEESGFIDLDIKKLDSHDIKHIESLANLIIYSNFKIKSYYPNDLELKKLSLRREPKVTKNIRIVEIDGFDYAPCGGVHLLSTGEIGIIKIENFEKHRGGYRIQYKAGNRAYENYQSALDIIDYLGTDLSVPQELIKERYQNFKAEYQTLVENNKKLKTDLISFMARFLIKNCDDINGVPIIISELKDLDTKEFNLLIKEVSKRKQAIQIYYKKMTALAQIVISAPESLKIDLNKNLRPLFQKYSVKGGGNKQLMQGSISVYEINNFIESVYDILKELL